ncbi:UDP-glucose 6-dehydrogenase TuaD [Candidatus Hydrogenisulfobacillus filiaventi]|uniref:UDP-glucose 6-dehydrogenase n=1 Tax=Candidatus Hydrogenisulfobacillus filiaventi TaxID=2707344 RepID=A0A6F8ZE09_9FIRM|nr:UDP-glucose/GDP-mannose dehydrogenase family protein [Bacillota bacterium]CAB1127839.1 UDP-glucose 6-dehydrogenase TuaD [Candidatus Hydrogenisulfobacillus filiaventi]
MNVAVFGAGYVGLVTGAVLADLGHQVMLVEVDQDKIAQIRDGIPPIYEAGLAPLLRRVRDRAALEITDQPLVAVAEAEVVFIAVGTPPLPNGDADLRYVKAAALAIGRGLDGHHRRVIVNKATVPIGSANLVEVWIADGYREVHGEEPPAAWYTVASNPEFLREGSAVADTLYPDRIVLGADVPWAFTVLRELYRPIIEQSFEAPLETPRPRGLTQVPVMETGRVSAEMIKYAANAFLATKISFANEIANICERVGADVGEVMYGIGLDSRIGTRFLQAGVGWGGSCFGKDLSALVFTSREYGYVPEILEATAAVNARQRQRVVSLLQEELKPIHGRRVTIWGLAFKPGTDDLRDAPALTVIEALLRLGVRVTAYDPVAAENCRRQHPDWPLTYAPDPLAAAEGAEAVVLMTEWPQVREVDLERLAAVMRRPVLIDGRNVFDPAAARRAGFAYHSIGR